MSNPLSVGIIAEGPTDHIMIHEIIQNLMRGKRDVIFHSIQPEMSAAFAQIQGPTGTGWSGVFRRIELILQWGPFQITNFLLSSLDLDVLIVHLDGDVSRESYEEGHLAHITLNNLPCNQICCPLGKEQWTKPCDKNCIAPRQRIDQLRHVLLGWMHLNERVNDIVLCTPQDASDTWVLAALFPDNKFVQQKKLECQQSPANILSSTYHINKNVRDYRNKVQGKLNEKWDNARKNISEAERFSKEFLAGIRSR